MFGFGKRRRKAPPPAPPASKQIGALTRDAGLLLIGAAVAAKALGIRLQPATLFTPAALTAGPTDTPDPNDPASFERLEPNRGRAATRPSGIPRRGWKDIGWRIYTAFGGDRLGATAAGVAFYVVLGVFPGISAFVSLYGLFFDPAGADEQLDVLMGVLPAESLQILRDQVTRIAGAPSPGLGLAFIVSLALALWSANGAVKALFDALNVAYKETEKRNILTMNLVTLGFTIGGVLFILTAVSAVVVAPLVLALVGYEMAAQLDLLRWPVLFALIVFVLAVVYRYGPCRQRARWRWVAWGSVAAAVAWIAASALFSWFLTNFGNYQATYGSLGAFAGFMVWTWLSILIVLLGAELNAAMEHQTAHDTTTGAALPLGQRGALVADTIGPKTGSPLVARYTLNAAQELSRRVLRRHSRASMQDDP